MHQKKIVLSLIVMLASATAVGAQNEPTAESDGCPIKPVCMLAADLTNGPVGLASGPVELLGSETKIPFELEADTPAECKKDSGAYWCCIGSHTSPKAQCVPPDDETSGSSCCCDDLSSCDANACCGWYALGEFLYLTRDNQSINQPVVVDNGGNTLLTTHDLQFNYEPGVRVLIGHELGPCNPWSAWELSYFGLFDWNATQTLTGNNDLNAAGDLGFGVVNALTMAELMQVSYSAQLHNVEFNCVKNLRCCETCRGSGRLDLLLGYRYLNLYENFNIFGDNVNVGTGFYDTRATNNLLGAQLGARLRRIRNKWGWEATGKAGIFGNAASQHQVIEDIGGFRVRDARASGGNVAFVGDLSLSALRRLNDTWMLRGGYNAFWISGVALAPDQLDFANTPDSGTALNTSGNVLVHGASLGLEAHW